MTPEEARLRAKGGVATRHLQLEIVALSFVVLFQELALIRWLPGQARVLGYFPNLILIGSFLGLGLGCLRASGRSLLPLWPGLLLVTVLAGQGLGRIVFSQESGSMHLYLLYYDMPKDAPVVQGIRIPIVAAFCLTALTFLPLGQALAQRLEALRAAGLALRGYLYDLVGSLLGVLAFVSTSFLGAFPAVWFATFLVVGLWLLPRGAARLVGAALGACALAAVALPERAQAYSPYYAIRTERYLDWPGFTLLANGGLHQIALDLSPEANAGLEVPSRIRTGYERPYALLGRPVRRALVVGAGTGNDVAMLLRFGAQHVDAVEIDPVILALGSRHPNQPYASPRVSRTNSDARSFLQKPGAPYDLIVFGTLDSMTQLSALSSVRLDNFVYTRECLRAARDRLTPDGGIVMYFSVSARYIELRLAGLLAEAFGEAPIVVDKFYHLFNRVLMAGPAFEHVDGEERKAAAKALLKRISAEVELPSDDWPYLYLRERGISPFYGGTIAVIAGLSVVAVAGASRRMRRSLLGGGGADGEMFLFGVGFLLLETRAVTEMGLVWGSTWLTSAVVFFSILCVVLASTLVAQQRPLPFALCIAALALCLLSAWALPTRFLLVDDLGLKLLLSCGLVGAPVFFAGLAFAEVFGRRGDAALAFGWNLLGAVLGGLMEFLSMEVGLKALLLVALTAYLLSALLRIRRTAASAAQA